MLMQEDSPFLTECDGEYMYLIISQLHNFLFNVTFTFRASIMPSRMDISRTPKKLSRLIYFALSSREQVL